jgi:hypothetical protein
VLPPTSGHKTHLEVKLFSLSLITTYSTTRYHKGKITSIFHHSANPFHEIGSKIQFQIKLTLQQRMAGEEEQTPRSCFVQ